MEAIILHDELESKGLFTYQIIDIVHPHAYIHVMYTCM